MPLLQRIAGFSRRRGKVFLVALGLLLVTQMAIMSAIPECHTARATLGPDSSKGYGQVNMLIARVTSRTLLEETAREAKLDAELTLGERLSGLPEEPALRLKAQTHVVGSKDSAERLELTVQGCNPSSATTAAQYLADHLVDYDRQLRHRTIAQRARGEDVPETTGTPARVKLEELRQKHPLLRDPQFAERFQRDEAEIAEEEIAVLALRKRHAGLVEQARALGELVRQEAKAAYAEHKSEQARLAALEREKEAKRAAEEERQARAAKQTAREGEPSRLSGFEAELRRMLATRTRRHPDVRRLMRKIELLRAEEAEQGDETPPASSEGEEEEESRPVSDERPVMPIADPEDAVALEEPMPAHWLQRAPRYSLWVEAQSKAAQAKVALDGQEQALERRKAKHAQLAKQEKALNAARLEEQTLLAAQQEEEALRTTAEDLPPIPEPLLILEQARVIDSSTPWRFFVPGLIFAGLLSLLFAWIAELQDRSFHEPADVTHRMELPVLGVIPHLRRGR